MTISATPANRAGPVLDPLNELHELLLFVAGGGFPSRKAAVDYLNNRSALLASSLSEMLPGFLYQCGTIDRFRDFIFLYDPDVELRREFIDRMISRARAFCGGEPSREPPRPSAAQPSIWEF